MDFFYNISAGSNRGARRDAYDRPEARAYNRGVTAARKEAAITDAWNRTFQRMSRRV